MLAAWTSVHGDGVSRDFKLDSSSIDHGGDDDVGCVMRGLCCPAMREAWIPSNYSRFLKEAFMCMVVL
jgi:hypothetical protein